MDYYARLERGNLAGASPEVLSAIARVLLLDEAETLHLHNLVESAQPQQPASRQPRRSAREPEVRASVQHFLDSIAGSAVWIRNDRMDYVAGNLLGRALYAPVLADPVSRGGNNALYAFLSPSAREFYTDWEKGADDIVATLRLTAGRFPRDKGLSDLIGALVTQSDEFSSRWASQNVRLHRTGLKRIHHPQVGDLELSYEALQFPDNPRWTMFAFVAEPGSASEERLILLGSLASSDVDPSVTSHG